MRVRGLPSRPVTAGLARLILGAGLCALAASPAGAQSFLESIEKLFRPTPAQEAPAAAPAPVPQGAAPAGPRPPLPPRPGRPASR
jgi:hypothetical protein